jgi:hypothetical protein
MIEAHGHQETSTGPVCSLWIRLLTGKIYMCIVILRQQWAEHSRPTNWPRICAWSWIQIESCATTKGASSGLCKRPGFFLAPQAIGARWKSGNPGFGFPLSHGPTNSWFCCPAFNLEKGFLGATPWLPAVQASFGARSQLPSTVVRLAILSPFSSRQRILRNAVAQQNCKPL